MANIHGLLAEVAPFFFPISLPIDYEPDPSQMLGGRAAAEGRPIDEVVYDFPLENDGDSFAIL